MLTVLWGCDKYGYLLANDYVVVIKALSLQFYYVGL